MKNKERESSKKSKYSYEKEYPAELSNMWKNCRLVKFQWNVEFNSYYDDVRCEVDDHGQSFPIIYASHRIASIGYETHSFYSVRPCQSLHIFLVSFDP